MILKFPISSTVSDVVLVSTEISEEEFALLVKCCSEGIEIAESDELIDLYYQLLDIASDDEEIDESVYTISYPKEVIAEAEKNSL